MYTPYVTLEEYENMGFELFGEEDEVQRGLITASRHIDTLTFNRIVAIGFENLTEFQQDIIKEVTCRQAIFEYENADEIESVLSGYTINGVTARFGDGAGVQTVDGVTISRSNYSFLQQTGLCCRLARFIHGKVARPSTEETL